MRSKMEVQNFLEETIAFPQSIDKNSVDAKVFGYCVIMLIKCLQKKVLPFWKGALAFWNNLIQIKCKLRIKLQCTSSKTK